MELFQSGSEYKLQLKTAKDRIAAYMVGKLNEDELNADEHEMMERWLYVWNLLNKYHTPSQAVESHIKNCESQGRPISRRTAYRDLRNATDLWGDAAKISKRAQLVLLNEFALKTFQMAARKKNTDDMGKALGHLIKLAAMNEDQYEENNEAHTYQLVINTAHGSKTINLDDVGKMKKTEYHEIIEAVEDDEMSTEDMRNLLEDKSSNED